MKATEQGGLLRNLAKAQIQIPIERSGLTFPFGGIVGLGFLTKTITLRILPEISDTKSADYPDENTVGRSFPIKNYAHSGNRQIGMKAHFVTLTNRDKTENLMNLRLLQSAVYPEEGFSAPYIPPPICRIRCGKLLTAANDGWLCVVLRQYSTNFPVDVVWDDETYLPYRFDVDLSWEAVFSNTNLPGQNKIYKDF